MITSIIPQNAGGIYQWRQLSTGKKYVGSGKSLIKRYRQHLEELKRQVHHNRHFARAWAKYGPDDFIFEVLQIVDDPSDAKRLIALEQTYLDTIVIWGFDFNISKVAGLPDRASGSKQTEATKRKIGESKKGKKRAPFSLEWLKNMGASHKGRTTWNKGIPHTEEEKRRISDGGKGRKFTEEHKRRISESLLGKVRPEEVRQKISKTLTSKPQAPRPKKAKVVKPKKEDGRKGRRLTEETKAKLSKALKGKPKSETTKARMSKPKSEEHRQKIAEANRKRAAAAKKGR